MAPENIVWKIDINKSILREFIFIDKGVPGYKNFEKHWFRLC